jgi:hypothetical protein
MAQLKRHESAKMKRARAFRIRKRLAAEAADMSDFAVSFREIGNGPVTPATGPVLTPVSGRR